MKKVLIWVLVIFLIVGDGAVIYTLYRAGNRNDGALVGTGSGDVYPTDLRGLSDDVLVEEEGEPEVSEEPVDNTEPEVSAEPEEAPPTITCAIKLGKVNIRRQGRYGAKIIDVLKYGDTGYVLEKGEKWSHVLINDIDGYVANFCMVFSDEQ